MSNPPGVLILFNVIRQILERDRDILVGLHKPESS